MFVCLQKNSKQCCDATKFGGTHCAGQQLPLLAITMSTTELCGIHNEHNQTLWHHSIVWRLFGDKQTSKSHET